MQQLDLFATPPAPAPAATPCVHDWFDDMKAMAAQEAAEPTPIEPQADDEPEDRSAFDDEQPCICAGCSAEGAEAEFYAHDASGGALCYDCLRTAEPDCRQCGLSFEYMHGGMRTRRNVLPSGEAICFWCAERRRINLPQDLPSATDATPEALTLLASLDWSDETHRNRLIYRLREALSTHRKGGYSAKEKREAKARRIEAADVNELWAVTRARPLAQIADDAWQLLDAYDKAKRGGDTDFKATLWAQIDRLEMEANDGTRMGIRVYDGPKRLWKAIRVRARAERRMPMWGVPGRFRFECRGMHVIADTDGLSMRLDEDRHQPGDLSFSSTGYRSFQPCSRPDTTTAARTPEEWALGVLEAYIDAPAKDGVGGRGGKLERWIPYSAEPWARFERDRREGLHARQSEDMVRHNGAIAAKALAWMQARGIDPFVLFPDCEPPKQGALL